LTGKGQYVLPTVTKPIIEHLHDRDVHGAADLLCEIVRVVSQALMVLEVEQATTQMHADPQCLLDQTYRRQSASNLGNQRSIAWEMNVARSIFAPWDDRVDATRALPAPPSPNRSKDGGDAPVACIEPPSCCAQIVGHLSQHSPLECHSERSEGSRFP